MPSDAEVEDFQAGLLQLGIPEITSLARARRARYLVTRITPITDQEGLTDAQASVFAALVQSRGSVRGPFGVLLHRPEIAAPVQELGGYLQFGATLPTPVRESVILTTARIWDCDHEWDTPPADRPWWRCRAGHRCAHRSAGVRRDRG